MADVGLHVGRRHQAHGVPEALKMDVRLYTYDAQIVCTENLNPDVVVMKSAKDRV